VENISRGGMKRITVKEEDEQMMLVQYIRYQYSKILFKCDLAGVRLSIGQAVKQKKLGNNKAYPDLFFPEPRGEYHGLFIELKRKGTRLLKKNGEYVNEHIQEQAEMCYKLREKGYVACIAVGFDQAKEVIDNYFKGE
jgi:hypothetical protein